MIEDFALQVEQGKLNIFLILYKDVKEVNLVFDISHKAILIKAKKLRTPW